MIGTPLYAFSLWGKDIFAHEICLIAGMLLSWLVAYTGLRRQKVEPGRCLLLLIVISMLTYFMAHFGYCLVRAPYILQRYNWAYWISPWQRGHMLYGGLLGAFVAVLLLARVIGQKACVLADVLTPAGLLMVFFVRVGEGLTWQGFGAMVEEAGLCFFPVAVYDSVYEVWFYAVFVAEAAVALLLFFSFSKSRSRFPGDKAARALLLYSGFQILFESMRQDEYLCIGFVRVSQLLSVLAIIGLLCFFVLKASPPRKRFVDLAGSALAMLALAGVCVAMEFALEHRITVLEEVTPLQCYGIDLLAVLFMMTLALYWRKRVVQKETSTNPPS